MDKGFFAHGSTPSSLFPRAGTQMTPDFFADLDGRGSHDVEVARIFRQKISRAFNFDEERHFFLALTVRHILNQWLGAQTIAGHVLLNALDHRFDRANDL